MMEKIIYCMLMFSAVDAWFHIPAITSGEYDSPCSTKVVRQRPRGWSTHYSWSM